MSALDVIHERRRLIVGEYLAPTPPGIHVLTDSPDGSVSYFEDEAVVVEIRAPIRKCRRQPMLSHHLIPFRNQGVPLNVSVSKEQRKVERHERHDRIPVQMIGPSRRSGISGHSEP